MILLRTTTLDPETLAFANMLGAASGLRTAFVVDERKGVVPGDVADKISLTQDACEKLSLFCPPDFAWRCGDYGFYLARTAYPDAAHFWMIENDVRFSGGSTEQFFAFFESIDADLLAGEVQAAPPEWFWTHHANARDARPHRCFFPVTRLSARALDTLLAKRAEQSRKLMRRMLWPNDEAFVATTLFSAGLTCQDFNAFGKTFYDSESFSFRNVIDGEGFKAEGPEPRIYHPVLFGEAYTRKVHSLNTPKNLDTPTKRRTRRVLSEINGRTRW